MPPQCQACGACCFSDSDEYVEVTRGDYLRLIASGWGEAVAETSGGRYMKMSGGRCAGLAVVDGQFACTVYEARPTPCRELDRGTPACAEEFAEKKARSLPLVAS